MAQVVRESIDQSYRARAAQLPHDPPLRDYVVYHLQRKTLSRRASTVLRDKQALAHVTAFLELVHGSGVRLSTIRPIDLDDYLQARSLAPGVRKGTTVATQTMLHELHALSNLMKRAIRERRLVENPVIGVEPPMLSRSEAVWLELDEAASLIDVAGEMDRKPAVNHIPFLQPLLATFLLTGGRRSEVFGLEALEIDLDRELVHLRPNRWRPLKRARHRRVVPLWPQLEVIIRRYLMAQPRNDLLFPALTGGMLHNVRGSLRMALERAGIEKAVTLHTLRHTYAATRIQTTDHGRPISPYTLMRELGHSGLGLIEKTYGHLQATRSRSATVAYERRHDTHQLQLPCSA